MRKIEHLGIAVKDLGKSNELFSRLFGQEAYKVEKVEGEAVVTSFFQIGDVKIELLEAASEDSAIAKFIDKRSEGIHHVAFAVDDIYAEMDRLKKEGFELLNDIPKRGADHKLVVFLHPRSTNGVLVELCQDMGGGSSIK
ncbi:methylmalonyl-CoA epimerase [Echinicola soli]|uniref:Methylmalonyl-CoA epimerase n=1 Tax=Echinicola soli TaxID=2591634 RepID=A0A514CCP4_9BACT|nr:methylmalonyl-CoA epimerase [Echinicola soli]QDH77587.1 methylmalonyl-CoA epimerase [Echinicola soli]